MTAQEHARVGQACQHSGRLSEAVAHYRSASELDPDNPVYLARLGNVLVLLGRTEEGVDLARQAYKARCSPETHSSYLACLHCLPNQDRKALLKEHLLWGRIHAPEAMAETRHSNVPDPDRRIRLGYVSADFRRHSVAYTFDAFLSARDRARFEVFGYSSAPSHDEMTEYLRPKFDHFKCVRAMDDEGLARLIASDRIDILVAVAGHAAENRLPALAYKPAPIQVDYGALCTIGMTQIDYRLTDEILDPPEARPYYLEELVYLPGGQACYRPPENAPAVGPLPALDHGYVTFGSFNGSEKTNPHCLSLWAEVLKAAPGSRMRIKCLIGGDPAFKRYVVEQFRGRGIAEDRLMIMDWRPATDHWDCYNQVDIALDTYPYNGGLTTLEGLWMGVPCVTLTGPTYVGRMGAAILHRVGLSRCVTHTVDQYVRWAAHLAADLENLARVRGSLRRVMAASAVCDRHRFAREVGAAYRWMWRRWCDQQAEAREQRPARDEGRTRKPCPVT